RRSRTTSRSSWSASPFSSCCRGSATGARSLATGCRSCGRSSSCRRRCMPKIHPSAIVYPGTILGEGVRVLEYAVVGKQPTLSARSTARRGELPPAVVGDGTIVSTGAILFAGTTVGARVILGDQSCVRERVTIGDDVVVGRGSLVENDTTIGALT